MYKNMLMEHIFIALDTKQINRNLLKFIMCIELL